MDCLQTFFLIKIVIHFHGRRGPLRTIVLPKWQAPSLLVSLRVKDRREVTWRGMGGGTFPPGVQKAKWEVGGSWEQTFPASAAVGPSLLGTKKAGILCFLLFHKIVPPSPSFSYPRRSSATIDRDDRATYSLGFGAARVGDGI